MDISAIQRAFLADYTTINLPADERYAYISLNFILYFFYYIKICK